MQTTIIVCDRCERRLGADEAVEVLVNSRGANGQRLRRALDLCDRCARVVLRTATTEVQPAARQGRELRELERELETIRARAADAAVAWAAGDAPAELLVTLRDIASSAARLTGDTATTTPTNRAHPVTA